MLNALQNNKCTSHLRNNLSRQKHIFAIISEYAPRNALTVYSSQTITIFIMQAFQIKHILKVIILSLSTHSDGKLSEG